MSSRIKQPDNWCKCNLQDGEKCFTGPPPFPPLYFFWLNTQGFLWVRAFRIICELEEPGLARAACKLQMKLSLEMFIAQRGRGCLLACTILASTVQGRRCPLLSNVPRGARESEASVLLKAGQTSTLAQQDMKCWGNIRAVITLNLQTQQWLLPD